MLDNHVNRGLKGTKLVLPCVTLGEYYFNLRRRTACICENSTLDCGPVASAQLRPSLSGDRKVSKSIILMIEAKEVEEGMAISISKINQMCPTSWTGPGISSRGML